MKSLLYYLIQVIICSGILYGYYHFVLRNKKFHLYNRYYLLIAVVLSAIIPFLNIPVYFNDAAESPSVILQTLLTISPYHTNTPSAISSEAVSHTSIFTLQNILKTFYLTIACFVLIRFLIAIVQIKKLFYKYVAERIGHIYFINTEAPGTPFSFFKWLFWNKNIELDSDEGQQVFRHELFHIEQKHSWDVVFLELVSSAFWINPFFYFIKKEIKAIHEFLADEFATKEKDKWNYAELVLMQVLQTHSHRLVNPFFNNQIKRRIAMITLSKKPSYQYLRKIMVLPLAVFVVSLFAFRYKATKELAGQRHVNTAGILPDTTKPANPSIVPDTASLEYTQSDAEGNPDKNTVTIRGVTIKDEKGKVTYLSSATFPTSFVTDTSKPFNGLVVVDGKERPDIKSVSDLNFIDPGDIGSIKILINDSSTIAKYGEKGKNSVIEIATKAKAGYLMGKIISDTTKPAIKQNDTKKAKQNARQSEEDLEKAEKFKLATEPYLLRMEKAQIEFKQMMEANGEQIEKAQEEFKKMMDAKQGEMEKTQEEFKTMMEAKQQETEKAQEDFKKMMNATPSKQEQEKFKEMMAQKQIQVEKAQIEFKQIMAVNRVQIEKAQEEFKTMMARKQQEMEKAQEEFKELMSLNQQQVEKAQKEFENEMRKSHKTNSDSPSGQKN